MRIELGAHVWSQDGQEVGRVSRMVVDTSRQTLDAFVVHTQWMGDDLIVPMRNVTRVDEDDTVHLDLTAQQFRELPQYVVTEFVTVSPTGEQSLLYDYEWAGRGMVPQSAPNFSGPKADGHQFDPSGAPLIGLTDLSATNITAQSTLSDNEFAVTKGTRVMSVDGHHVGNVHELSVSDDGKLRGLVVTSGHIRRQHHLISMEEVADADSDAVYLRMTAEDFKQLEQADAPQN